MRRAILTVSLFLLLVALVQLWNRRYEPTADARRWTLTEIRQEAPEIAGAKWIEAQDGLMLSLRVDKSNPRIALRLLIPGIQAVEMIHVRYRMAAKDLIRGKNDWETGRIIIEWHSPDGLTKPELDPLGGIQGTNHSTKASLVATSARGPAVPVLRLENLGSSGEWTLQELEIIPLRESELWRASRWFLAAGWFMWIYWMIRSWTDVVRWRVLAAATIWLLMGWKFAIPGPWKTQQGIAGDFHFEQVMAKPESSQAPPLVANRSPLDLHSGAVAASGKILVEGRLALKIKLVLTKIRPLLHVILLCAPTFASALLVGRRPTIVFAASTALAIEMAQHAFGYGFDWRDVFDLFNDALGILLGLWLAGQFGRIVPLITKRNDARTRG